MNMKRLENLKESIGAQLIERVETLTGINIDPNNCDCFEKSEICNSGENKQCLCAKPSELRKRIICFN